MTTASEPQAMSREQGAKSHPQKKKRLNRCLEREQPQGRRSDRRGIGQKPEAQFHSRTTNNKQRTTNNKKLQAVRH